MISSSYFPPAASSNSSTSTPVRPRDHNFGDSGHSISNSKSPNFNEMPTADILTSATTRSAFLQSLQRSREREERRERELERERAKDQKFGNYEPTNGYKSSYDANYKSETTGYTTPSAYNNTSSAYNSTTGSYNNTTPSAYNNTTPSAYAVDSNNYNSGYNGHEASLIGSNQQQNSNAATSSDKYCYDQNSNNNHGSSVLSTPIMSRRRLSSNSPASSVKSSKSAATPVGKVTTTTSTTPASQSKLAVHAFTLSRSSTEDENDNSGSFVASMASSNTDFKRKYEEQYMNTTNMNSTNMDTNSHYTANVLTNSNNFQNVDVTMENVRNLIESVVESNTISLKNDLQNLHIELIKQSVVQQNAFRSLLETYLPLTGKLMETLSETREENERLKMRIEELSRRKY